MSQLRKAEKTTKHRFYTGFVVVAEILQVIRMYYLYMPGFMIRLSFIVPDYAHLPKKKTFVFHTFALGLLSLILMHFLCLFFYYTIFHLNDRSVFVALLCVHMRICLSIDQRCIGMLVVFGIEISAADFV